VAVVTNIEPDHLEYYGSFERIVEAFQVFVDGIKPGGTVVACIDDPAVARLIADISPSPAASRHPLPQAGEGGPDVERSEREGPGEGRRVVRYGLGKDADVRAINITFTGRGTTFEVPGIGTFTLFVPGEHNVRNALAAIAVGRQLGIDTGVIAHALAKFLGVDRRFQILGEFAGAIIVDDYAHHPTEIRATLTAARRGYPERRIVALFQPHLYSRTRDFWREFAQSLLVADVALVAPIFAAREEPMPGVTARLIADASKEIEFLELTNEQIVDDLRRRLRPNDLFITMGAGDVHEIGEALVGGVA
jgi:UDP-N-acetylmuramate--alanine ligase